MSKEIHFIVMVVTSAALLAGCSQPEGAVPQNINSQKRGSGKNTSEVQNVTSSEISMVGQPKKGAAAYMTADINSDSLMETYQALGTAPTGKAAVKLSTGEPGNNYLCTDLVDDLVQSLQTAVVGRNTAYGGARSSTAMHYQVAKNHGYTTITDINIMDKGDSMTLPVTGGADLTENYVGEHFSDHGYYVILSHFKDHAMIRFGGAIKNISIGLTSAESKNRTHTTGKGGSTWSASQGLFLESVAETGKSITDALNGNTLCINVMSRLNVDCDCDTNPAEPDMRDIGILASYDPMALGQACVGLAYAAADGQSLVNRIESRNGIHTLKQAEKIGLWSRTHTLVNLDE